MIKKTFKQMLATQIVSSMTVMICMFVDSIMIGKFLGEPSITAYGLTTPVLLVFAAFGTMLSAGIQVMCGKTVGNGDREGTNACYSISIVLASIVSFVGLVVVFVFANPICTLLGAGANTPDNEVFRLTHDYLIGFIIGAPAFIFAQIMVPFLQLAGHRKRLIVAVGLMTVFDITFDILNVFVFKKGTFGMGLASSISYYIAFVIGIVYFLKKECIFSFRLKSVKHKTCLELIKYGIPTVINQLSLVLVVFVLNKILINVGSHTAVASYSVISSIGNICYCFGGGIASVALMLSSMFYIEEDRKALRLVIKTMLFYGILLNAAVIVVVMFTAPYLVRLFLNPGTDAYNFAVNGVRLFSLSLLHSATNSCLKNYYQGVNREKLTNLISFIQNFLFTAAFAFLLSRFIGITGVWLGWICGEGVTLFVILIIVFVKNKKISISADALALLPKDFGAADEDCMESIVLSKNDSVEVSRQAYDFCLSKNDTKKNSMLISLCIEEMVNNIVDHGFTKDNKQHSVEIRLIWKKDTRVIRIRDNCRDFDPIEYMNLHSDDDPSSHIGIRLVMKMVKDAKYVNSIGLNNLTLVL